MYRDRVGKLKLAQHIERVGRKAVIEAHDQAFLLRIDALELAHVAVEHARAGLVAALPDDVVVVAHLHDAVALAEDNVAEALFAPVLAWRIERLLQTAVERSRAAALPSGRGQHLNLRRRKAVVRRKAL